MRIQFNRFITVLAISTMFSTISYGQSSDTNLNTSTTTRGAIATPSSSDWDNGRVVNPGSDTTYGTGTTGTTTPDIVPNYNTIPDTGTTGTTDWNRNSWDSSRTPSSYNGPSDFWNSKSGYHQDHKMDSGTRR